MTRHQESRLFVDESAARMGVSPHNPDFFADTYEHAGGFFDGYKLGDSDAQLDESPLPTRP